MHASVSAEVLARLLASERLTSLDAVTGAGTTRLASLVHYLITTYLWPIASEEKAAACRDGRVAWVAEYHLPGPVIARAMAAGAADWCASVRAARSKQRSAVANAARLASEANEERRPA
jgi:hypothetical protein